MFPGKRLHRIWAGERFSSVFSSEVSDLVFLCLGFFFWSQICSLRLVFPRHAHLHDGRWLLPIQQPPATVMSVLHARRVAYTRQGDHFLDRCVWVTACLPRHSWRFFNGSEVFRQISATNEVSGGSACTPATAPPNAGPSFGFCFMLFFLVCSQFASVMLKSYWTIC
jgi:hypothetical protein